MAIIWKIIWYNSAGLQVLAQSVTTTPHPTEAFNPKAFVMGTQNIMNQLLEENKGCIKLLSLLCSWNYLINWIIQWKFKQCSQDF